MIKRSHFTPVSDYPTHANINPAVDTQRTNWVPPVSTKCSAQVPGEHQPLGKHYLVDLFDVDPIALAFLETDQAQLTVAEFIKQAGMTLLASSAHRFPCGGITAVWLLSESHVSIHTWPENRFIALDVYTCGAVDPSQIVESFRKLLNPDRMVKTFVSRGSKHSIASGQVSKHDLQITRHKDIVKVNKESLDAISTPSVPEKKNFSEEKASKLGYQRDYTIKHGVDDKGNTIADICINGDDLVDDCIMLKNTVLLIDQNSPFQRIEVIDTNNWGRCMLLDRVTQYCENDNLIYTTELIERPFENFLEGAVSKGSQIKKLNVHMIGGGDGWVPSAILDHYSHLVDSITAVDIDPLVSEITQNFFQPVGKTDAFKDKRVQWIYQDAGKWMKTNAKENSMDIIIIDCTDHTAEAAKVLYTQEFYDLVFKMLKPGGKVSQQMNTNSPDYKDFFLEAEETWIKSGFRNLEKWQKYIPSFLGESVFWMAEKPDFNGEDSEDEE
ncbi:hypothetical protein HDU92_005737 [Lobulomyces angularis]|nr:hypothetical protein HDU92_005737 [Lobulomyces angularis]